MKVGHRLSLGIVVLLCLVGFGVAVAGLFVGWWFTQRRRAKKKGLLGAAGGRGRVEDKVELRNLGTSSSSGSGGSAVGMLGGKKSREEGSESERRSERSRSESNTSVKFVGVAGGEVDEFGDGVRCV